MFTFSLLRQKTLFGQIYSEKSNCQFKLKCGTKTNLNIKNSKVMFTLSVFNHKYLSFLGKIDPRIQSCLLKMKFDTKANSNMQKLMLVLFYLF